jgi:hypothetical protein
VMIRGTDMHPGHQERAVQATDPSLISRPCEDSRIRDRSVWRVDRETGEGERWGRCGWSRRLWGWRSI